MGDQGDARGTGRVDQGTVDAAPDAVVEDGATPGQTPRELLRNPHGPSLDDASDTPAGSVSRTSQPSRGLDQVDLGRA